MKNLLVLVMALVTMLPVWARTAAVDFNLSLFNENLYLGKKATLIPLSDFDHPFSQTKTPLILVHGINGNPSDLQDIVYRLKDSRYQLFILAYDDYYRHASLNGEEFGDILQDLSFEASELVIVAYSMGGIVARKALVDLVKRPSALEQYTSIRFFSIDTPWHGFDGPSDYDPRMSVARPFMPDGLEDMRAKSSLFKEMNSVTFPSKISVDIAFAQEGDQAWDYTEAVEKYVLLEQYVNLESALRMSSKFPANAPMKPYSSLEKYFPRFPGDHMTVVKEHEGTYSYLDYLQQNL